MECEIGTWDADLDTGLVTIGPAGAAIGALRLPAGPVQAAALVEHVHSEDRDALARAVMSFLASGPAALRHELRLGDGADHRWIEITGRQAPGGRHLSGVWVDVTSRRQADARKDEAVARVHQFAAAASHDLIGPLRHIAMYGDLLISDFGTGATQEKRQMLQAVSEKARNLQVLTKRMIAFSTDAASAEFIAVPLDRVVSNVLVKLAQEIEEAGAVLASSPLPVVTGDPVLIEKVVENLVRNALEWRGARTLVITIDGAVRGRSATITVADNGVGVDPRYATRIFDAFWSLPRPGQGKGAGLGLAVCKTITGALGGGITLRSSSPEGSVFEVVLPAGR